MKKYLVIALALIVGGCSIAQQNQSTETNAARRPKIIVGITVDQMRYDYIERFWDDFGNDGFKRLVNDGFFARNLHYNYMPTYTGPGHAAIYTGTSPAYNGIIANDWYERTTKKMVYCSSDSTVVGVGTASAAGKMSPHYLKSTTLGDELKLFTNGKSKVIGVALKDRGAILPAGRSADAAYWFVGAQEGVWATSNWYRNELPQWVSDFNASGKAADYMKQTWTPYLTPDRYSKSSADNNPYELPYKGTIRPTFPYVLDSLKALNGGYELLKATPFGNTMSVDFALAALTGEQMGQDEFTDMLCLSFSATDYVGHQFGMHSMETQDVYVRLDLEIARLLKELDARYGKDNYLLFLSADHAGAPTPSYTSSLKWSAGYWKSDVMEGELNAFLQSKYGEGNYIESEVNQNIFLNRPLLEQKKVDIAQVNKEVVAFLSKYDEIMTAYTTEEIRMGAQDPILNRIRLGFSSKWSGDVIYVLNPDYMEYGRQGTTHGSPFIYDTHVPALFYGFGVTPGTSFEAQTICDIAPTVAAICKLPLPNACIGQPIKSCVK
ncbi:MAG: alkaline phosphatase PafA [Flavobacteriales bacterium]